MIRLRSSHGPLTPECVCVGGLKSKLFFYRKKMLLQAKQESKILIQILEKIQLTIFTTGCTLSLATGPKLNNIYYVPRNCFSLLIQITIINNDRNLTMYSKASMETNVYNDGKIISKHNAVLKLAT